MLPASKKIVLVELTSGLSEPFWLSYSAGVWFLDLSGVWATVNDSGLRSGLPSAQAITISQVYSDATPLTLVPSVLGPNPSVESNANSYYFDGATNILYISTSNFDNPNLHSIIVGSVFGYSNQGSVWNQYIYDGRVKQVSSISKSKDPVFFGKISFDGGSIVLDNADGALDSLYEVSIGNYVAIKAAFNPKSYSDFKVVSSGYVSDVEITEEAATVSIKDLRQQLSNPVLKNSIQNSNAIIPGYYPNASLNLTKPIPVGYGTLFNIPCLIVNDGLPDNNDWVYVLLDTTTAEMDSIDNVYYTDQNGKKSLLTLTTHYTKDPSSGTITILHTSPVGNNRNWKITADCVGLKFNATNVSAIQSYHPGYSGTDYTNGVSIINDILYVYGGSGFVFTASVFDQAEWEIARGLAEDVGIYIDEASNVIDKIQEITSSLRMSLIVRDDGRYTLRKFDPDRSSIDYFKVEDMLVYPSLSTSIEQSITSDVVGYAKNWDKKEFQLYRDSSYEVLNYIAFKKYLEPPTYETLLTTLADAQSFSNDIKSILGVVSKVATFKVKMQDTNIDVMDFVDVDVNRPTKTMIGKCQVEVINVVKDLTAFEMTVSGRIVQVYPSGMENAGSYYDDFVYDDSYYGDDG